ncbi:MAG: FtsX-like permease family protein [Candidatus Latescibacteria bacterium]|jgi:putative ABC transport system permease protein|nr:FtsX-like permease family protein [Candidatus Latescibacterota bacterium]
MIQFLLKGLLRDRHRSLFPVLIVAGGVAITVLLYCYLLGFADETIRTNAKLDTGHVKIMTRAYAEIASQIPNDLAFSDINKVITGLKEDYPEIDWAARIKFGGLLDIPDDEGETRAQGPVFGIALDLFNPDSGERQRFNLENALVNGRLPQSTGEILVSEEFAGNLDVEIGETATLISSTVNGSMAIQNFTLVGTIRFGIGPMDSNAMLADITDIQYALDMENGAAEILGYFPNLIYNKETAYKLSEEFNARFNDTDDEFSPVMITLSDQNGLGEILEMMNNELYIIIFIFIFVMSIVLWNTGLMSGIRRYGEVGIRLAIGESKGGVYLSMIYESVLIGCIGTVIGTAIGLGFSYYMQEVGIDFSKMMKGSSMLMSNIFRSRVTLTAFYIGFIPGLLATVLGSMISGIGIFKRQTAQLFKELET